MSRTRRWSEQEERRSRLSLIRWSLAALLLSLSLGVRRQDVRRSEYDDCERLGQAVFSPFEFRTPLDEADFALHAVGVPPVCIRSGGQQAYDRCAVALAFLVGFTHPRALSPEGRIHPADAFPRLRERVIGLGVVSRTLGVFRRRTHVEREFELGIEWVEHRRGRFPGNAALIFLAQSP